MRRRAGVAVTARLTAILFATMTAALSGCGEATAADACNDVEDAAVVELALDGQPQCLGVRVALGWVLTAQHCVQPLGQPTFAPARLAVAGGSVMGVVVRRDSAESLGALTGADLALVRIPGIDGPLVTVGSPSPAASCASVRRHLNPVAAPTLAVDETTVYTDALTRPGDSGGPLLDLYGDAVGIASWKGASNGPAVYTRIDAHEDWLWSTVDE